MATHPLAAFARHWLGRAVVDTIRSAHRAALFVAVVVGLLTDLIDWARTWHSGHTVSAWGLIWPGLAVAGVILFAFFGFHFFATPFRLLTEQHQEHQGVLTAERSAHDSTREDRDALRDRVERLEQSPVSPQHFNDLKGVVERLRTCVMQFHYCDYGDGERVHGHWRQAFESHFPAVAAKLEIWDAAIGHHMGAGGRVRFRVEMELDRAGVATPWAARTVIENLMVWAILMRVGTGISHTPFDFHWRRYGNFMVQMGGNDVFSAQLAVQEGLTIDDCVSRIEDAFWRAQNHPEVLSTKDSDGPAKMLQRGLLDDLLLLARRDNYVGGCLLCR